MAKLIIELTPEDVHSAFQDCSWIKKNSNISFLQFYHFKDDLRNLIQDATEVFYVLDNQKFKLK